MKRNNEATAVRVGVQSCFQLKDDFYQDKNNYLHLEELQDYLPPRIFKLLIKELSIQDYPTLLRDGYSVILSTKELSMFVLFKKVNIDGLNLYVYMTETFPKTSLLLKFCETHQMTDKLYELYKENQSTDNKIFTKEELAYLLENGVWIYDLEQAETVLYNKVKNMTINECYSFFAKYTPSILEQFEEVLQKDLSLFVSYAVLDYYTHLDITGRMFAAELDVDNILGVVFDEELIDELNTQQQEQDDLSGLIEFLRENGLHDVANRLEVQESEDDYIISVLEDFLSKLKNKSQKTVEKVKEKSTEIVEDVFEKTKKVAKEFYTKDYPSVHLKVEVDENNSVSLEKLYETIKKEYLSKLTEQVKEEPKEKTYEELKAELLKRLLK